MVGRRKAKAKAKVPEETIVPRPEPLLVDPAAAPTQDPAQQMATQDPAPAIPVQKEEAKPVKREHRGILIKNLKDLAMERGCQSTPTARRLIKGTFSKPDQKEIAIAVMMAALENTGSRKKEGSRT